MWRLRKLGNSIEQFVGTFSESEVLVREATNENPWGTSSEEMEEISRRCNDSQLFYEIMGMLWFRLSHEPQKSWLRTYKSLLLLEYLIINGPVSVVNDVYENLPLLQSVQRYRYLDSSKTDKTGNIVHRSKEVIALIDNQERLREERQRSLETKKNISNNFTSYGNKNYQNDNEQSYLKTAAIRTKEIFGGLMHSIGKPPSRNYNESKNNNWMKNQGAYDSNVYSSGVRRYQETPGTDPIKIAPKTETKSLKESYKETDDEFGEFVEPKVENKESLDTIKNETQQNQQSTLIFDIFEANEPEKVLNPDPVGSKTNTNILENLFGTTTLETPNSNVVVDPFAVNNQETKPVVEHNNLNTIFIPPSLMSNPNPQSMPNNSNNIWNKPINQHVNLANQVPNKEKEMTTDDIINMNIDSFFTN